MTAVPVVMDIGSVYSKVGVGDAEIYPSHVFPTIVATNQVSNVEKQKLTFLLTCIGRSCCGKRGD